jgi:hypothetical protein
LRAVPQMMVMAAIVATLVYLPAGLVLPLLLELFGISIDAVVTFGGFFNFLPGMLVWWLVVFAVACIYTACVFPWGDEVLAWPRKR